MKSLILIAVLFADEPQWIQARQRAMNPQSLVQKIDIPAPLSAKPDEKPVSASGSEESRAFALINEYRQKNGRSALTMGGNSGCQANNDAQNRRGLGHHTSGSFRGECAAESASAENVVRLWINSPPHRAILLSSGSTGSIAFNGKYWTFRVE